MHVKLLTSKLEEGINDGMPLGNRTTMGNCNDLKSANKTCFRYERWFHYITTVQTAQIKILTPLPLPLPSEKIQTHVTNEKVERFLLGVMFINNPQKDETVLYACNRIAQNAHTTSIEIIIEH